MSRKRQHAQKSRRRSTKDKKGLGEVAKHPLLVAVVSGVLTAALTVLMMQMLVVRPSVEVSSIYVQPGYHVVINLQKVQCSQSVVHMTYDDPTGETDRIGVWRLTEKSVILEGPYGFVPQNIQAVADCAD